MLQHSTSENGSATRLLGAAVVGLGVGEQHARAYVNHPACGLRWIYDIDPAASARGAATFPSAKSAGSLNDLLLDEAVDIVSLASYDDAHFGQVVASLNAGKHVFVEKPLCRSLDELRQTQAAWQRAGNRHLVSNLVLRGAPLYLWLRSAIAAGELGEIYAIDGDYLYGRLEKITGGWRAMVENYSVMQGGGVHLVDLMLWLTRQRPVAVTAAGNRISTARSPFPYQDFVAATFQFESGLVGRITANFGSVHPHQHVLRVFGTRATFIYDDRGARLHASRDAASAATPVAHAPLPASKGVLIPAFVESIVAADDGHAAAQQEFDLISACLAADRAAASAAIERVEYV